MITLPLTIPGPNTFLVLSGLIDIVINAILTCVIWNSGGCDATDMTLDDCVYIGLAMAVTGTLCLAFLIVGGAVSIRLVVV